MSEPRPKSKRQVTMLEIDHARHCPAWSAWDIPGACNCDGPYKVPYREPSDEPKTRAERRRSIAESTRFAYRLLAKVRRPDLVPFSSTKIAEAIGLIEASRTPWRR